MKIKTIQQFQKLMREIGERDNLHVSCIFCIECRMFSNDHNGDKDFFAIARQRSDDRYRSYYLYANTMYEPKYTTYEDRDAALEAMRHTINCMCLL